MKKYNSFDFLSKLSFVRTAGSSEEDEAGDLILNEIENGSKEEFLVDGYTVKKAVLKLDNPSIAVECVGVGQSGSTTDCGVTGELAYITSVNDALIEALEGKIVILHMKLVNYKLYKILVEKKVAGLILCCGDVYSNDSDVDLDPYQYRERHYNVGKIPAVCIRMKSAEEIIRVMPKMAHIELIQDEYKNKSHNVVTEIKGSELPDEVIAFTAHYDSVSFSKGAYDNGTGSTTILELYRYFKENPPKRTMRFIWCGAEEMGLLGSKAYCLAHKEELNKFKLVINVDMTGVVIGTDIACCTAEANVVSYIDYFAKIKGFGISPRQGVYSSDSTPFADCGIPAISFARLAPAGGAKIHSHLDVMDHLDEANYYKTCEFIEDFAKTLDSAVAFPINKNIPDNMKTDLDYYLGRKEKPE